MGSRETGLNVSTPVSVGTIDAGAESFSVRSDRTWRNDDDVWLTIFMIQVTDNDQARDERLWVAPLPLPWHHGACWRE